MYTRLPLPSPRRWPLLVVVAAVVVYLALSLDHLGVHPPVGEDEPWIAAAPYKLATEGVYGSDLFAGYYGVERHNYQHMPVYPLMQAGVFKALGVGVYQMRLLPVAFGLALLLVVFLVGRQLGDARIGAVAVVLMVALRIADANETTGILLLDRARISRYDIAVPVFGLLALAAFNRGVREDTARWWIATSVLTGLSSLSHLFGVFWLPVFLGLLLFHARKRRALRAATLLVAGFLLTWVSWIVYVFTGWSDYLGQMRFVSARFDLFDPAFYTPNLLRTGPISWGWLAQVVPNLPLSRAGAWTVLVGTPVAAGVMAWKSARGPNSAAWALAVAALAQFAMFVLLLQVKTINYMIGLWPLGALLLAWLGVQLWDSQQRLLRAVAAVIAGAILVEGGVGVARARAAARYAMPYESYTREIAGCIPPGSLVLGLQHYWLGLRQYRYRAWLVPVLLTSPRYYDRPMTLDAALERIDPDIILIDRFMSAFFENAAQPQHPNHRLHSEYAAFVARRDVKPLCVIQNRTYGTMAVYAVPKGGS